MSQPFVSIVIPAFNSASTLVQTIEACMRQDYPPDKLEIIVVDDGSQDNTKGIVEGSGARYICQARTGPASARNNGWRNSRGDAVCFIDADCIPSGDWVSKLTLHYIENDIGAVAGSYSVDGSRYLLDKFVHYEIRYRHSMMPEYINSFGTYNVMVKRSVLEELNGFNAEYVAASGEDSDLSYRIIKAGYKIYFATDALVSHKNILRFGKYLAIQFKHGYWRMKLYRGNAPMIVKDKYTYWKDFLELSLAMLTLLFLAAGFRNMLIAAGIMAGIIFILQLPLAVIIAFQEKNILYAGFSFVTFVRTFARVIGGVSGFIRFWVFAKCQLNNFTL